VQAQGFNEVTQRTQITVGSRTKLDFTLAVAAVTGGTVEVVAGGGIEVNTQTQELSTVISENQIRQLPTLTRNPYNLVALSGNVSTADPTGRGAGVAINGQRAASTNILLIFFSMALTTLIHLRQLSDKAFHWILSKSFVW
jgi:hypothetical protein